MTTLIGLTEENSSESARANATHVVEVPFEEGGVEPCFFSVRERDHWSVNPHAHSSMREKWGDHMFRYARAATPAEIAAHNPSASGPLPTIPECEKRIIAAIQSGACSPEFLEWAGSALIVALEAGPDQWVCDESDNLLRGA